MKNIDVRTIKEIYECDIADIPEIIYLLKGNHLSRDNLHTSLTKYNQVYEMRWNEVVNMYKKFQLGIDKNLENLTSIKIPKVIVKNEK